MWEDRAEIERTAMYKSIRSPDSQVSLSSMEETKEKKNEKKLMRQDSDAESATLARTHFLEGKQVSERRHEEAMKITAHYAPLVVLNTVDEIVTDPQAEADAELDSCDDPAESTEDLLNPEFGDIPTEVIKYAVSTDMSVMTKSEFSAFSSDTSFTDGIDTEVNLGGSLSTNGAVLSEKSTIDEATSHQPVLKMKRDESDLSAEL